MKMIKIWDNYNKQWLEPICIYFGKENTIWRIDASIPNEDPITNGWYSLHGDELQHIAIIGEIEYNIDIIPKENIP